MSDLNTRIPEILSDAFAEMGVLNLGAVADVLIRELGLRLETHHDLQPIRRYVTEWTADE